MNHRPTHTELPDALEAHRVKIDAKARELGLDYFDVVFEVLDFQTMNQIAAYGGFPVRYPHWRF
ncbi:MAG: SpoVR family protein, partial [Phycisphaerales bacterium]|nr:SpoVR family protein [Phycisphaerales bacterium]